MLNFPNHAIVNVSGGPVLSIDVGPDFAKMIVLSAGAIEVRYNGPASGLRPFLQNLCGNDWTNQFFDSQYFGSIAATSAGSTVATPGAVAASTSGQAAQSVAIADLNGDGNLDTVFISTTGAVVQLQASDGSVLSTKNVALGFSPAPFCCDIVAADFNHDGKSDLAITNYFGAGGSDLVILLGNGDGTFGNPRPFAAGANPVQPVVADFNGDGKPDIAVGNSNSGTVSLLLGNGDGTFGPPVPFATGEDSLGAPRAIIALDLNGDSTPDLAVANGSDKSVSVLLNSGGSFKPPMITALPFSAESLAYADLNHDGKLDLAAVSENSNALVILTGNGDGTFQAPASYATTSDPESVGVLPLGDGYTVICTVDRFTYDVLATIVSPQGQVLAPLYDFVGGRPIGIAAGDLNGDGQPDVVITGTPSGLSVAIAQSGTQFKAPVGYSLDANSSGPRAVAIGDLNGDNKQDVVTANNSDSVSVLLGNGDGTLQPAMSTPVSHTSQSIALADFNGDQKLDVVVAGSVDGSAPGGGVTVLLGNGGGAFQTPLTMNVNGLLPVAVAAGDLNGDGKQDLAVLLVADFNQDQPATAAVFLGQGNGTFAAPRTFPSVLTGSSVGALAIGDVNGDSKPDLVMISPGGNQGIDIMLGDGAGNFHEAAALPTTDTNPWALVLADLNRDGKLDLVVGHFGGAGATFLLGNGDGTFRPEQHFISGPAPIAVAVTKFSGGLGPDLVFAQADGTWLSVVNGFRLPIVNVTSTAPNGTYGPGAMIPITITYGGPVTVTGTPQLALNSGGIATYVSGSGSATLTFNYAVAAGQSSAKLDYSSTDAMALNGGTILDANQHGASFTLPPPGVAGSLSANKSIAISSTLPTVLSIAKSHSGNFTAGQTGATYTVTVSNTGQAPTSGAVTVTETMPGGLTLTSMAGIGWSCPAAGTTCTRSDALAAGASYPPITITVNVAANATSPQVNTVAVTGGATATDSTVIAPPASLSITKTHTGNFAPGQQGAAYTVTVANAAGAGSTNGLVTVTETPPIALTLVTMSGAGWNCASGSCSRTDALPGGSAYPPIAVTVNVASNATSPQTNLVKVSGGGSANASASDSTIIATGSRCDLNGDGSVSVGDVQILINMVLGAIPATPNADLNGDGKVDVADVQVLINVVLGKATCPN